MCCQGQGDLNVTMRTAIEINRRGIDPIFSGPPASSTIQLRRRPRSCQFDGQSGEAIHGHVRLPVAGNPRAAQRAIAGDPMSQRLELHQLPGVDVDHLPGALSLVVAYWWGCGWLFMGREVFGRAMTPRARRLIPDRQTARRSPVAGSGGRARVME